jgi:putative phosphoribosyl transferase
VELFRAGRPRISLADRTVILVDDGIATGGTVRAAILAARAERPKAIVLAVPVAAPEALAELAPEVDAVVCLEKPRELHAIGVWYDDFAQTPDEDVIRLLRLAERERAAHASR